MKQLFASLSTADRMQYLSLLLLSAALIIDANLALWASALVAVTSVIKIITHLIGKQAGGSESTKLSIIGKLALLSPIVYWLIHLAGTLFSNDMTQGIPIITIKASIIILPLSMFASDLSYLNSSRLRTLFTVMWATCTAMFLWHLGQCIVHCASGVNIGAAFSSRFDPRHHAYTALYADSMLLYAYCRLRKPGTTSRTMRRLLYASIPLLIAYVVAVNSRAGLLVLWFMIAIVIVDRIRHIGFSRGIAIGIGLIIFCFMVEQFWPGHQMRIISTVENIIQGKGDTRIDINRSSMQVASEQSILGSGTSDYHDRLVEKYESNGLSQGAHRRYNAHNQFMESFLSTGIIGLLSFLIFITAPLWTSLFNRRKLIFATSTAVAVVMINLAVESMLERQMGILFISFTYTLLILAADCRQVAE